MCVQMGCSRCLMNIPDRLVKGGAVAPQPGWRAMTVPDLCGSNKDKRKSDKSGKDPVNPVNPRNAQQMEEEKASGTLNSPSTSGMLSAERREGDKAKQRR